MNFIVFFISREFCSTPFFFPPSVTWPLFHLICLSAPVLLAPSAAEVLAANKLKPKVPVGMALPLGMAPAPAAAAQGGKKK